jgi:hypothetical protein
VHPRPRGWRDCRERRAGSHLRRRGRPHRAGLYAAVRRARLHLLPEPEDQPLPQDTSHAGAGGDAGRHVTLHKRAHRGDALPLHGVQHHGGVHGAGGDLLCQGHPGEQRDHLVLRAQGQNRSGAVARSGHAETRRTFVPLPLAESWYALRGGVGCRRHRWRRCACAAAASPRAGGRCGTRRRWRRAPPSRSSASARWGWRSSRARRWRGCGGRCVLGGRRTLSLVAEIYLCGAVPCQEISRRSGRGQARRIIAVDVNTTKFPLARAMGATDCVDPADARHEGRPVQEVLVGMTEWGLDYTFDCTGNVTVMRAALEAAHRGWGVSCVIGVAAAVRPLRPFLAICARWEVTCYAVCPRLRSCPCCLRGGGRARRSQRAPSSSSRGGAGSAPRSAAGRAAETSPCSWIATWRASYRWSRTSRTSSRCDQPRFD